MKKVLLIVGPTATGKSELAINIARKYDVEIISADSIQFYKDFNIGSGKIEQAKLKEVKHHLIDFLDFKERYSIKHFQDEARRIIDNNDKKFIIICGGSGLYLKTLVHDYQFISENENNDYNYDSYSTEELYQKLISLEKEAKDRIHINNRKRIIRSLELIRKHKQTMSQINANQSDELLYDCLFIERDIDREKLYDNINQRVDKMFEIGLEAEVKSLIAKGADFNDQPMSGIGYKEFKDYFNGSIDKAILVNLIKRNSRRYAKKQLTWFRNQEDVKYFKDDKEAFDLVDRWLNA